MGAAQPGLIRSRHRNPTYFLDSERFDPDRWTPQNEAQLPRYTYLGVILSILKEHQSERAIRR